MGDSISKRHEKLRQQQHANIDSWCGRAPVLDSKSLDSSMKKNTGFIKKCKTSMGQDNSTQLVREVKMLKLEKYVSEIVPAVAEGLQKCRTAGDFAAAIDIISALHSRFPLQFTVPLIKLVLKGLMPPILSALAAMSPEQREKEEQARLSRQKTLLRVVAEMYLNGLLWGIDSLPGGIDGLDAAAAFMLSYASPSANSSSAGSSKQVLAKVKEMVQQPGHCVLVGALQNLFLSDKEHHLSIVLATTFAKTFRADFAICKEDELSNSAAAIIPLLVDSHQSDPVVGQENCRRTGTILHDYLDSAVSHLENMHKTLTKMRRNNEERLFNKGIIHVDVKEKLEYHTKSFSRLSDNVQMLCEALDQEIPHFDDGADDENQLGIVFDDPAAADAARDAQAQSQWADEEERGFYEAVLDLQSELPPSMLAAAHKKSKSQKEADAKRLLPLSSTAVTPAAATNSETKGGSSLSESTSIDTSNVPETADESTEFEEINESDINFDVQPGSLVSDDVDDEGSESINALGVLEYQKFISQNRTNGGFVADLQAAPHASVDVDEATYSADVDSGIEGSSAPGDQLSQPSSPDTGKTAKSKPDSATAASTAKESTMTAVVKQQAGSSRVVTRTIAPMSFSNVLRSLTTFTSKEDADKAAVAFCYVNNQSNREALVRALVEVPRQQLYIIPYYARFIAILHRYFPEIGENVVDELKREFNWLVKQRFKNLTDVRLKNIKYIAELTKFKVAPLHVAYRCAKSMLEQFHVFNIEVLCALLEGCGRFLMAQPLTSARVSSLLEIIMRKRRALNLDERSSLLIENAYYACLPLQARKMVMTKYRTPYELYIRKLIYEDLTRSTVEFVCQKLRKLPWGTIQADDPQRVGHALVNCFTKIWKVKYSNVYIVTMILGALGRVHPWFRVAVVDAVLERVKLGLEHNLFTRNQRRITEARYIGEMFIYKIVDSKEVFELLYFMLRYGHSEPHPVPGRTCDADMSNDYFRIRLVCTLLSTCGQYISSRSAEDHRELEKYATYLQMYILAKEQPLPVDISYNVDTLFENALASVKQFGTWGEAAQAMATIVQAGEMQNSAKLPPSRTEEHMTPEMDILVETTLEDEVSVDVDASEYLDSRADSRDDDDKSGAGSKDEGEESFSDDVDAEEAAEMERIRAEDEEMEEARQQMEALEALLDQEEEDLLEREFNKLVLDSTELRKTERSNKLDVGIPMNLIGRSSTSQKTSVTNLSAINGDGLDDDDGVDDAMLLPSKADGEGDSAENYNAIRFSLLTGKKQKPVVRDVNIPLESQIARNLRQQEEMAMREKAHLKRIVLSYERREAEEEQRRHEQWLAIRKASRIATAAGTRTAPVVPGATFVNRTVHTTAHRRRQRASASSGQRREQNGRNEVIRTQIPDHFL
ncbi:mRNA decay protein [Coemansia spiralis]|uniref:mRNA decay protein n=2 Tax=Coemansia TaxID=4863 RepID=A0A9W8KZ60_9FUNG|nr:mRNA decay protein [Coemansia umbellata]KAJ2623355.1 mRNA decay protein [Coemansia sp. RSA 1358]KAJ2678098.1 mRNA decay protein [Coemansia spiralis]